MRCTGTAAFRPEVGDTPRPVKDRGRAGRFGCLSLMPRLCRAVPSTGQSLTVPLGLVDFVPLAPKHELGAREHFSKFLNEELRGRIFDRKVRLIGPACPKALLVLVAASSTQSRGRPLTKSSLGLKCTPTFERMDRSACGLSKPVPVQPTIRSRLHQYAFDIAGSRGSRRGDLQAASWTTLKVRGRVSERRTTMM